jgi:hypothetical protein
VAANKRDKSSKISSAILDQDPAPKIIRTIETSLARFGQHKKIIIDQLSNSRHSKVDGFDNEKWWGRLVALAELYFLQKARPSDAERKARLLKLATLLGRACSSAEIVRQDSIGSEMISPLFEGILPRDPPFQLVPNKDGLIEAIYLGDPDFKGLVSALSAYEKAVLRAANYLPTSRSGKSPFLPPSFIRALAAVYEESTGRKAGAGAGPFVRFVIQFRAAVDPSYKSKGYLDPTVIDAVVEALRRPRWTKRPSRPMK